MDGLLLERVRILSTWFAFLASGNPRFPELGIRPIHTTVAPFPPGCPPSDAAVLLGETDLAGDPAHDTVASFVRSSVEVIETVAATGRHGP